MEIKMVCLDLDGTLLDASAGLSPANRSALQKLKEKGIYVVIASGRNTEQILRMMKEWEIEPFVDFVLGCNSAQMYDCQSHTTLYRGQISLEGLSEIHRFYPGMKTMLYLHENEVWSCWPNPAALLYAWRNKVRWRLVSRKKLYTENYERILLISRPETIEKYRKLQPEKHKQIYTSFILLELFHPALSKLSGILLLAEQLQIRPDEILSFGDDYNDEEMLEKTVGVFMANGRGPGREKARFLARSNVEDGVACFLQEHGIIQRKEKCGICPARQSPEI